MLYRCNYITIETQIPMYGWKKIGYNETENTSIYKMIVSDSLLLKTGVKEWPYIEYHSSVFNVIWNEQFAYNVDIASKTIRVRKAEELPDIFYSISLNFIVSMISIYMGNIPLHAAGLESPEKKTFLFLGDSGVGKSTMVLHLARQGWKYISEELCVLNSSTDYKIECGQKILKISKDIKTGKRIIEADGKNIIWDNNINTIDSPKDVFAFVFLCPERNALHDSIEMVSPQLAFKQLTTKYIYTKIITGDLFEKTMFPILKLVFSKPFYNYRFSLYPNIQFIEKIADFV